MIICNYNSLSLIINPDPKAEAFLSVGLLFSKSLNISPKGEPGGN